MNLQIGTSLDREIWEDERIEARVTLSLVLVSHKGVANRLPYCSYVFRFDVGYID